MIPSNLKSNNLQLIRHNTSIVKKLYPNIDPMRIRGLRELTRQFSFSVATGDVIQLENAWFVTPGSSGWLAANDARESTWRRSIRCATPQRVGLF